MRILGVIAIVVGFMSFSSVAMAQGEGLDKHETKALHETKRLLKSPAERQEAIEKSSDAKKADDRVQSVSGSPENAQRVYELSAEIFDDLVQKTGGDPEKMMKLLNEAQRNPKGFAGQLSPEQLNKLRSIANEAAKQNSQMPPAQ